VISAHPTRIGRVAWSVSHVVEKGSLFSWNEKKSV